MSFVRVVSAGGGGKCKGRKAVDFEQGNEWHIRHNERRASFPSKWLFDLINREALSS